VNLNRTFVISSNVFREVIRDRVLYLIGFFALAMAACIGLLPKVAAGTEHKLMLDVGLATMNLLGVVIAVFVGTTLVNKELEKRTVYVMMAKPISRIEFILGKHLGLSAVLAVLVTAMTSLFLAALINQQVAFSLPSILLTALFQFLELSLVTAIAILFGVFTSSLLATLFTFGIYLMGHCCLWNLGKKSGDRVCDSRTLLAVTRFVAAQSQEPSCLWHGSVADTGCIVDQCRLQCVVHCSCVGDRYFGLLSQTVLALAF
jgi:hypothetical protein